MRLITTKKEIVMSIPDALTYKGNVFKAEDLAIHDTFIVPQNSPIADAIKAIKKFSTNVFLDSPVFRIIAKKNDYEIIRTNFPVEQLTKQEWTVTLADKIYLYKDPSKQNASINMNEENDDAAPAPRRTNICSRDNCAVI